MLNFEHRANYLYREDAYREFSFSTDAYGQYQPASFIYLSFESFKDFCFEQNINIFPKNQNDTKFNNHPWKFQRNEYKGDVELDGLIIRVFNETHSDLIWQKIKNGKNVLALIPREMLSSWFHNNEKNVVEFENIWKSFINKSFAECNFDWIEYETNFKGRLFIAHDDFISDGSFFQGYQKHDAKTIRIKELVNQLKKFKYSKFSIDVKNKIGNWICGEPIDYIFDIINYGDLNKNIDVKVEIINDFEPISSIEFMMPEMNFLGRQTLAFKIIPRVIGEFKDFVKISINNELIYEIEKKSIVINPSYNQLFKIQQRKDDDKLSVLTKFANRTNELKEIQNINELFKIDLNACLNKIRSTTEKLCYLLLKINHINLSCKNLNNAINEIKSKDILSQKSVGYLHAIRLVGNLASHSSDEILSETDVQIASFALASIIEEMIEKEMIKKT